MTKQYLKPLALAVSLALTLTACGKSEQAAAPAPAPASTAPAAPAAASTTAAADTGKSIFDGSEKAGALKLVDHFVAETGVTIATYEPAGDVRTGTFETKKPSEQELQRREKMREGGW